MDAENNLQAVRDRIAAQNAELQSLESELTAAQANVVTAKEIELAELNAGIDILVQRRDALAIELGE